MSLKKLRLEKGWSQEQLSDISGVSARTLQRLEKGGTAGLETQKALAAAFDLTVSDFQKKTSKSERNENMEKPDSVFIEKEWKGFVLHALTFMVVITWLFFMARTFEFDQEYIAFVVITWGGWLFIHLLGMFEKKK